MIEGKRFRGTARYARARSPSRPDGSDLITLLAHFADSIAFRSDFTIIMIIVVTTGLDDPGEGRGEEGEGPAARWCPID